MKYPYPETKPKGHDQIDAWLVIADALLAEVETWLAEHAEAEAA